MSRASLRRRRARRAAAQEAQGDLFCGVLGTGDPNLTSEEQACLAAAAIARSNETHEHAGHEYGRAAGEAARDEAVTRVEEHAAEEWIAAARLAVELVAKQREIFTSDDLWKHVESPREPRALGAVMGWARRAGFCEPTDRMVLSARVACHRRPLRVWRSCLYGKAVAAE